MVEGGIQAGEIAEAARDEIRDRIIDAARNGKVDSNKVITEIKRVQRCSVCRQVGHNKRTCAQAVRCR
jgi:hypothetical protein